MGMNTLWGGTLTLPKEHYTEERVEELLDAMNIPIEVAGIRYASDTAFTMEPNDAYGGYLYEDRVPPALAALQAEGYLRATSDFDVMEFEASAGKVRIWNRADDALTTAALPGFIRIDDDTYALSKVQGNFPWTYPEEPSLVMAAPRPRMRICWPGMGRQLRIFRRNRGLTQEAAGEAIGISWMSVHRWETEQRGIIYELLVKILAVYLVDIDDFLPCPPIQEAA